MSLVEELGELTDGLLGKHPGDPWRALAEGGLLALAAPAENGGEGLGVAEAAAVLTALGRRALNTPALMTTVAVLTLTRWGTPEQREAVLRPVAEDAAVLSAALTSGVTAQPSGTGFRLDGIAPDVPCAGSAHRVLVPAALDGRPVLMLADPGAAGISRRERPTSSGAPSLRLGFERAEGSLVPGGTEAAADLQRIAAACAAAFADGLVAGALALTARHVADRHQFGRPLVTLQAVALNLADVAIVSSTLHLAAVAAAASLDHPDPDAWADPEVAALFAVEDARAAVATCHHLHGGTGLDVSYPLPAFSAAATDLAHLLGGPDHSLTALADRLESS